jgi:glucose/mannose-6-phosphate isomerase
MGKESGSGTLLVKGGLPPRSAIGYLFVSLLRILSDWGIYDVSEGRFALLVQYIEHLTDRLGPGAVESENTALALARDIGELIPVVYSGNGLLESVAYRWKFQFNENSKVMSYSNTFPELGHNEVMGWDSAGEAGDRFFLIFLTDADDHPKVARRMEVTYPILSSRAGGSALIDSGFVGDRPPGRLERLLYTVLLGDFASVYLALERGIDPTPIDEIETIKRILRTEER